MNMLLRLCFRVLRFFLGGAEAASVIGDLEEERSRRKQSALWMVRQCAGVCVHCVATAYRRCNRRIEDRRTIDNLFQDVKYAARILARNRSFTLVAVLALTLAIGATTTVFSFLDAAVFGPIPLPGADRIYQLNVLPNGPNQMPGPLVREYEVWRDHKDVFEAVSPILPLEMAISTEAGPELLPGLTVAAEFFDLAGVKPVLGRAFLPEEDQPGGSPVVVLGYGAWQRLFGGDKGVIGRSFRLRDFMFPTEAIESYTVIGVMPEGFRFPPADVAILAPLKQNMTRLAQIRPMRLFGRLRAGLDERAAGLALARIEQQLAEESRDLYTGRDPLLMPLRRFVVGPGVGRLPILLMGAVVFVLLIAVSNVANLMLGQAAGRSREIAVRFAVGAKRLRIVRQLLTECMLIALIAGGLGLACTAALTGTLAVMLPQEVLRIHPLEVDWRVAAFATLASISSGVLFGLYPAYNAARQSFSESLKQGRRARLGRFTGAGVRSALTVGEVALAMILCIGAGLLMKSFAAHLRVDVGVKPENVVMLHTPAANGEAMNPLEVRSARYHRLLDAVGAVPGVTAAALTSNVPMVERAAGFTMSMAIEEYPLSPGKSFDMQTQWITPSYFTIMGAPILRGRNFGAADTAAGAAVAIVSEATARQYWPDLDPIGKRMTARSGEKENRTYTVVGVVKDVKKTQYEEVLQQRFGVAGMMYLPMFGERLAPPAQNRFLVFRGADDPHALLPAVRKAIMQADKDQAISRIDFFDDVLRNDLGGPRFRAFLVGSFAAIAMLIAVIGVYGVVSHLVASRIHEMGVRIVMGAQPADIMRLVVGHGLALVFIGIVLGVGGSLALTRLIESFLFQTDPFDSATFAGVSAAFAVVAFLACWLPARRAANADPLVVLRTE